MKIKKSAQSYLWALADIGEKPSETVEESSHVGRQNQEDGGVGDRLT